MDCDALTSASATFIQKLRCGLCNEKCCNYSYFISDDFLFIVIDRLTLVRIPHSTHLFPKGFAFNIMFLTWCVFGGFLW